MRRGWWIAGVAVRIVLLLILLFGALVVALSVSPTPRTLSDFRSSLTAGRVSVVSYRVTPGERGGEILDLRWSEGPLIWHRGDRAPISGTPDGYTLERLMADAGPSWARVVQEEERGFGWWYARWPFGVPAQLGLWWVGAAWVVTFLIMVGSTPRLGNRWAWFWMFGAGQVGALAFLLLEPRPLWYRYGRRPPPRSRVEGGLGCLLSVVTATAAVAAAVAVGNLLNAVLP
ncbi:hypothetical protein AB0395_42385 [Streptosporangium sp. NPDC051023]|uniref:hypothetical protein n=1 Tax=Streptosporangium sp. NPDC051023 TaxID=3155410 RepID=UPI00344DEE4D